ncbi:hypothetical protein ACS0PU_010037 [Formica fusca]
MTIRRLFRCQGEVEDGKSEQFFFKLKRSKNCATETHRETMATAAANCQRRLSIPHRDSECRHRIDILTLSGSSLGIASGSFWARTLETCISICFFFPTRLMYQPCVHM